MKFFLVGFSSRSAVAVWRSSCTIDWKFFLVGFSSRWAVTVWLSSCTWLNILFCRFFFTMSRHGLVEFVHYHPDEHEEALILKKAVVSAFSAHVEVRKREGGRERMRERGEGEREWERGGVERENDRKLKRKISLMFSFPQHSFEWYSLYIEQPNGHTPHICIYTYIYIYIWYICVC